MRRAVTIGTGLLLACLIALTVAVAWLEPGALRMPTHPEWSAW